MAIEANTPVPIPNGWTLAKHLKKGDYVFSSNGLPIQVQSVHAYTAQDSYEVLLNDGVSVLVDNDCDPDDIRVAFKGDTDVKTALAAYIRDLDDEPEEEEFDDDDLDSEYED